MSKIQDRIKEIDKSAKRSRLIAIILSVIIIGFVVVTGLNLQTISKNNAKLVENDSIIKSNIDILSKKNIELDSTRILLENLIAAKQEAELKKLADNNQIWENTQAEGTVEAYLNYLKIRPDASNKNEVIVAIDELLNKTGYVQIKESNGNDLFIVSKSLDGFYTPKSARSVRKGVIGNDKYPSSSRNGDVILPGQLVKIEEEIGAGKTAKWAKINYSKN